MGGKHHKRPLRKNDCGACGAARDRERAIAELAANQHGVVTRGQLQALGFGRHSVDHRLKLGRLHALHRGVYLVATAEPPPLAREMAAVLACGLTAVISHGSAANAWCLLRRADRSHEVAVTVVDRDPGHKPGIRIHRVGALDPWEVRRFRGLPITTPARTLLDLAGEVTAQELEQAVAEAEARGLARARELLRLLARHPRRPGSAALKRLLEGDPAPAFTRSQAEERLLALIRAGRLPEPNLNAHLRGHEVDFLWREQRLVVEVDGFAFHGSRSAFERDRLRDAELQAEGFRVLRVTWRQLTEQPEAALARIAMALAIET